MYGKRRPFEQFTSNFIGNFSLTLVLGVSGRSSLNFLYSVNVFTRYGLHGTAYSRIGLASDLFNIKNIS